MYLGILDPGCRIHHLHLYLNFEASDCIRLVTRALQVSAHTPGSADLSVFIRVTDLKRHGGGTAAGNWIVLENFT